jgi:CPA1 family monovalent cation:H+ antiporter
MVAAGLITENHSKIRGMSDVTAEYVDKFWELIDEILNAVLFVLIFLELLVIQINQKILFAAVIILFITLIAGYISVYIPSIAVRHREKITQKTVLI